MIDPKDLVDVLSLAPFEAHALLNSRDKRRKVVTCYLAMREKIATDFLPLVPSKQPYINDHSRSHLERVLNHIEGLLAKNFPYARGSGDVPDGRVVTWADAIVLLNALVWHDIANIYGRKDHGINVRKCFNAVAAQLYDGHLGEYIQKVATAHSGDGAIQRSIPDTMAEVGYQGERVHLQFLAAVLRLADEIDEDHRRAQPYEYDQMGLVKKGSRRFWFFSKANASIEVQSVPASQNFEFWIDVQSKIPRSKFDLSFPRRKDRTIRAMAEYISRILKFERERSYCNPFLRKAYYHPGVAGIRVHLESDSDLFEFVLSDSLPVDSIMTDRRLSVLHPYFDEALTW